MHRKLLLLISIIFLFFFITYSYRADGPSVSFQNPYAEVGVSLKVKATGYPFGTDFTYQWYIDGKPISCFDSSYIPQQEDLESFISVTVTPSSNDEPVSLSMYFSKLPVLYLNVEEEVLKDEYIPANLTVQSNSKYPNTQELYCGDIQIKGRGNSTWETYPKKPYKIKLDSSADFFDMGKSKHWLLLANYAEESLMRNKIAYDLSGILGMPYMESTWVTVIYNGEYIGNYQLCEQIRIEKGRIDISDLTDYPKKISSVLVKENIIAAEEKDSLQETLEQDLSWLSSGIFTYGDVTYDFTPYITLPELTGGFLMEIDWYLDKPSQYMIYGLPIMFDTPENAYTNEELMSYAHTYFEAAFGALLNSNDFYALYDDTLTSYTELFDVRSLAQYILIQEIFFNYDADSKSNFLYKEVSTPAHMGPIWDMDWSSGRTHTYRSVEQWWSVYYTDTVSDTLWYSQVIKDPYFLSVFKEVWDENREAILALVQEDGILQQTYEYLYESAVSNSERWFYEYGFQSSYDTFYQWMCERLAWLDEQFVSFDRLVQSVGQWTHDPSIEIHLNESQISAVVPYGSNAVLYYNGIRYGEQAVTESTTLSWENPYPKNCSPSDVITIRIYDEDGLLVGSNYLDRRD